ncbi:helix-turn-helix domain-containing protein [Gemella cuniculi]|uniref:helix-turn-helix domain-containing protein n=1 Tax=Gemella cuniculi TaxID=150240 RepID=UPI000684C214|nr:helix-turn-helix domain-containing protein [Gemella cuniculi]
MENNKNKHLTLDDRITIQTGITNGKTFRSLGIDLGKGPTTISKEVKRNFVYTNTNITTKNFSGDILSTDCTLLKKLPYVCNSCAHKRLDCRYKKRFYYAETAHKKYLGISSDDNFLLTVIFSFLLFS